MLTTLSNAPKQQIYWRHSDPGDVKMKFQDLWANQEVKIRRWEY